MGKRPRRYRHPKAGLSEFDTKAIKPIRLFGEDLAIFKTRGAAPIAAPSLADSRRR